jgi:hypothetical protein
MTRPARRHDEALRLGWKNRIRLLLPVASVSEMIQATQEANHIQIQRGQSASPRPFQFPRVFAHDLRRRISSRAARKKKRYIMPSI